VHMALWAMVVVAALLAHGLIGCTTTT